MGNSNSGMNNRGFSAARRRNHRRRKGLPVPEDEMDSRPIGLSKLSERMQKASEEGWNYVPGDWPNEAKALENRLDFIKLNHSVIETRLNEIIRVHSNCISQANQEYFAKLWAAFDGTQKCTLIEDLQALQVLAKLEVPEALR